MAIQWLTWFLPWIERLFQQLTTKECRALTIAQKGTCSWIRSPKQRVVDNWMTISQTEVESSISAHHAWRRSKSGEVLESSLSILKTLQSNKVVYKMLFLSTSSIHVILSPNVQLLSSLHIHFHVSRHMHNQPASKLSWCWVGRRGRGEKRACPDASEFWMLPLKTPRRFPLFELSKFGNQRKLETKCNVEKKWWYINHHVMLIATS